MSELPSDIKAIKFCSEGDDSTFKKEYLKALVCYNKSLCFSKSNEVKSLAFSGRSAVYFYLKKYQDCLDNIKLAREHGYPADEMSKLDVREVKCKEELGQQRPVREAVRRSDVLPRNLRSNNIDSTRCYEQCNNCLKPNMLSLIPCKGPCTKIMFCSEKCINAADALHTLDVCINVNGVGWCKPCTVVIEFLDLSTFNLCKKQIRKPFMIDSAEQKEQTLRELASEYGRIDDATWQLCMNMDISEASSSDEEDCDEVAEANHKSPISKNKSPISNESRHHSSPVKATITSPIRWPQQSLGRSKLSTGKLVVTNSKNIALITPPSTSAAAAAASVPKTPVKAALSPAVKPVEAPKTANTKKAQTPAAPTVVSSKSTPAPSAQRASSPQPSSSTASGNATTPKTKRSRVKAQPYQCPTSEVTLVTKLSTQAANSSSKKRNNDTKLTIFYNNDFLAVRSPDGGYYLCQTMQNVYKSSSKIHIRWLDDKNEGKADDGTQDRTYTIAYFDTTDFKCVLTTVELEKVKGKTYKLPKSEQTRIESILKKAIGAEKGIVPRPAVTEENSDGLDLSLGKDEAQLDKVSPNKRKREMKSDDRDDDAEEDYNESPRKKESVRREPLVKSVCIRKAAIINDESTESDEENLMEIKKKAKKQAETATPKIAAIKKAPEPTPSTSKASATPVRGRKRGGKSVEHELPSKIVKIVEKVLTLK